MHFSNYPFTLAQFQLYVEGPWENLVRKMWVLTMIPVS